MFSKDAHDNYIFGCLKARSFDSYLMPNSSQSILKVLVTKLF